MTIFVSRFAHKCFEVYPQLECQYVIPLNNYIRMYTLHFVYPFITRWAFRLFPSFDCYRYANREILIKVCFSIFSIILDLCLRVELLELQNIEILFNFLKLLLPHAFIFPPKMYEKESNFSTSSPTHAIFILLLLILLLILILIIRDTLLGMN